MTEVAHDYQSTIKQYVEELGTVNSYDTWHGMVPIRFQCGAVMIMWQRDAHARSVLDQFVLGIAGTWFTELFDNPSGK